MSFKTFRKEIGIEDGRRMTRRDYLLLGLLLTVYSIVAFINLGTLKAPQTAWKAEPGTTVIVDLGETTDVSEICFYGNIGEGSIALYDESAFVDGFFTYGKTEPLEVFEQDNGDMFKWKAQTLSASTRYLILYAESGSIAINEISIRNGGEALPATVYEPKNGAENLLDEQKKVPKDPSYLTNMYFDEIYHARTAYEMVQNDDLAREYGREYAADEGYPIYEWTHPSFGKLLIALGIRIFGMTPFGWRFSGTFFGVLILAVLYVFGKRIFQRTDYAFITAALFSVDCMHFAQTRIATIDVYALFFTLLMFLFMFDYVAESFEKRPFWKKLAALGLCGVSFGLGASSKWTCLYSGAGLAVLYFGDLVFNLVRILGDRLRQPKKERKRMPVNVLPYLPILFVLAVAGLHAAGVWVDWNTYFLATGKWDAAGVGVAWIDLFLKPWVWGTLLGLIGVAVLSSVVFRTVWKKRDCNLSLNNLLMTPVWCCLFFIAIPLVLYVLTNYCYYIDKNCVTMQEKLSELWRTQVSMYRYHADLQATHQCQSMWYQWPLAQKSVWFYSGYSTVNGVNLLSNISSTGNPAVWYVSAFGAVLACVQWCVDPACHRDRAFIVAFVGILSGLLPWALVTRCVFLYHYFSTIPFVMLMTLLLLCYTEKKYPRTAGLKWVWLIVSAVVFVLMYPAVSGVPVPYGYAKFIENVLAVFGKVYYVGV